MIKRKHPAATGRGSYYSGILYSFMGVCTLLVIVSSVLLSAMFFQRLAQNTLDYNEKLLRSSQSSISKVFEQVHSAVAQLSIDKQVTRYMSKNVRINYEEIGDLLSRVSNIVSANDYADSLYIAYPHLNIIISSDGFYDYGMFHDKTWLEPALKSTNNLVWIGGHTILRDKISRYTTSVVSLVYKMPFYSPDPSGFIVYNVRQPSINELLCQVEMDQGGTVMLLGEDLSLIASNGADPKSEIYKETVELVSGSDLPVANASRRVDGKFVYMTALAANANRWTYVSAVNAGALFQDTIPVALAILAATVVLILLSSVYANVATRKIYRPVAALLEYTCSDKQTTPPAPDNYLEFRQINQSVLNIVQERTQLAEEYQRLLPSMRDKFYLGLLFGQITYNTNVDRYVEYLNAEPSDTASYVVCVLTINRYTTVYTDSFDCEQQLLHQIAVQELLAQIAQRRGCTSYVVELPTRPLALILGTDDEHANMLELAFSVCSELSQVIKDRLPFTMSAFIGNPVHALEALQQSYEQAREAMSYEFLYGDDQIVFYSNIQQQSSNYANPLTYQRELISAVKTGSNEDILQLLSVIRGELIGSRCSLSFVKRFLSGVTNVVILAAEDAQAMDASHQLNQLQQRINDALNQDSFDEAFDCVRNVCLEIADAFRAERAGRAVRTTETILNYIRDHYSSDISLADLSSAILYTPAYINRILKQTTKKTFYDLLTDIRIEKATELLVSTNCQVVEISESVGYLNVQSFIRMFKKITGITPGKYRELHRMPD